MIAYKLFSVKKNGEIGPLFINRRMRLETGVWYPAEDHPTKGFAHRPGWHALLKPEAPHLSEKDRAWYRVEIEEYEIHERPESQGGKWALAKRMRVIGRIQ